jgi:hypothetical protein
MAPRRSRSAASCFCLGNTPEYGGGHRPNKDGPPAYDLLQGDLAPRDVYEHPEWYTGFEGRLLAETMTTLHAARRARGESLIRVYRAGPHKDLNDGDWVTLSKGYADAHRAAVGSVETPYLTCAFQVPAGRVLWAGDDLMEFGYFGPTVKASVCRKGR